MGDGVEIDLTECDAVALLGRGAFEALLEHQYPAAGRLQFVSFDEDRRIVTLRWEAALES